MIDHFEWLLLGMALITFGCRYLFFMKSLPITLRGGSKRLLRYTAPSVLTAMWVPIVFLGHQHHGGNLPTSPYLYAGIITLLVSMKIKNTLAVTVIGMVVFALISYFFNLGL